MKIKIFQSMSETKVETKVNSFIAQKDIKVLEIQYQEGSAFSVMVVYEDANSSK